MGMGCNVIAFYEKHDDKAPCKTMTELLPFFKNASIKTICIEEPSDESREEIANTLVHNSEVLLQLDIDNVHHPVIENAINAGIIMNGKRLNSENVNSLSTEETKYLIDSIKDHVENLAMASLYTVSLFNKMDDYEIQYCSMDLPRQTRSDLLGNQEQENSMSMHIRNIYMKENILKHCAKGDVAYLVGASHFSIAELLKDEGINVKEYYITSTPIEVSDIEEADVGDFCLRTKHNNDSRCGDNYKYTGMVLDLHDNPTLDVVGIIKNDIETSCGDNPEEL